MDDETLRFWEFASYVVTVVGLPLAVLVLWREARIERRNEMKEIEQREEETYLRLSEQYTDFLNAVLEYPELGLHPRLLPPTTLTTEQQARKLFFFEMLIALFERAFILLHRPGLDPQAERRWQSWADYINQWCTREDFREALPMLLHGEDEEFSRYILAQQQAATRAAEAIAARLNPAPAGVRPVAPSTTSRSAESGR